jgi:hypothetical protein
MRAVDHKWYTANPGRDEHQARCTRCGLMRKFGERPRPRAAPILVAMFSRSPNADWSETQPSCEGRPS